MLNRDTPPSQSDSIPRPLPPATWRYRTTRVSARVPRSVPPPSGCRYQPAGRLHHPRRHSRARGPQQGPQYGLGRLGSRTPRTAPRRCALDDIARAKAVVPAAPAADSGQEIEEQMAVRASGAQDWGVARRAEGRNMQERLVRDVPVLSTHNGPSGCPCTRGERCHHRAVRLCRAAADIGSGSGRKRAQRTGGPLPYVTEYQHMLKSEKSITPRAVLVCPSELKVPEKRISGDPLRCGGIGELEA
ncbi:hypothetical protein H4582DRAFT_1992597 [Lactarius indigo]|nr:hypothetical protein H4582DRAFT_1992597 [Lactarius indigo]